MRSRIGAGRLVMNSGQMMGAAAGGVPDQHRFPVQAIDDVQFMVGPGTVTTRLRAAFADFTANYVKRNKKLRVLPRLAPALSTA